MNVALEEVLNEYRDHVKLLTDDLLLHKAALKNVQKRLAEVEADNARLKTEDAQTED